MDEELSWALPDGLEEREETPSPAPAPVRLASPPATLDQILTRVGPARLVVFDLVRSCVDDFEKTAPWRLLYYPPEEPAAFLALIDGLIQLIHGIPGRISAALVRIPEGGAESDDEPTQEDVRFMLSGIHYMVEHDLKRLESVLAPVRERGGAATAEERQLLCELSSDLKGKYASSMMGAAASLIAQGLWNGVETEPVLFPEKAEEFRNTRELVELLREVSEAIRQFPEQVPFADLLAGWQEGRRVDQYALADFPSLRGRIAKLLKERTRRALYSGDYHQISRRELLLTERMNEMETLHQKTWASEHGAQNLAPTYQRLVQLTLETAAILDVTLLKSLLGDKKVDGLRARVTSAKMRPVSSASNPGAGLDALIPLLAEDDLRIFLDLLLGAVMRRASLAVILKDEREKAAAAAAAAAAPVPAPAPTKAKKAAPPPPPAPEPAPAGAVLPDVGEWTLPPPKDASNWNLEMTAVAEPWSPSDPSSSSSGLELWNPESEPVLNDWLVAEPEPAPPPRPAAPGRGAARPAAVSEPGAEAVPRANLRPALKTASDLLDELLSAGNSNLNAFKMTQRLLSKHARIPSAMFQSTHPYLKDIQERLAPALRQITPFRGITEEAVQKLEGYCRDLRRPGLTPAQMKGEVPKKMERLVRFLEALRAAVPHL